MSDQKTLPTDIAPVDYVTALDLPRRRDEGFALHDLFARATGWSPRMWGPSIVGYGVYDYTYASGRTGTWMATGFSPRKAALSVYIMPGYANYAHILDRLGPHRMGKSCLYITRLDRVDQDVLEELIVPGIADLSKIWPVRPE